MTHQITKSCYLCGKFTTELISKAIDGEIRHLCIHCFEYVVIAQDHAKDHNPVHNGALEGGNA